MKTLKTPIILLLCLTFLNLLLLLINIGAITIPQKVAQKSNTESAAGKIRDVKLGKETEIAGYKIKFTNPRYEFDEKSFMDTFKVDAHIQNVSFEPLVRLIANCDIVDSGKVVMEGAGVRIDSEEDHINSGESIDFTIVGLLEIDYSKKGQTFADDRNLPGGHVSLFPNRRVSSCSFTPTGSYDPNIAVKINFE